jgi:hypothetical protein
MQPMTKIMNIQFAGTELMTGLPEYRNGGLFIDTGVLILRREDANRGLDEFHLNAQREGKRSVEVVPMFKPDDDVVVEWRAVTVGFLDQLLVEVNASLGLQGTDRLTLPQMLEAGSWKVCSKIIYILSNTVLLSLILIFDTGRARDGRDITAQYPMSTHCHSIRRHSFLDVQTSLFAK